MALYYTFTAPGTYQITAANQGVSPVAQIKGLTASAGGGIVPYVANNPPGETQVLQAGTWRVQGSQLIRPAGNLICTDGNYEFQTGGLALWFTITNTNPLGVAMSVTMTVIAESTATATDPTVNASDGLVLDTVPITYPPDLAFALKCAAYMGGGSTLY